MLSSHVESSSSPTPFVKKYQKLRRTIVKKMIFVAAFVAALFSLAVAEDVRNVPATAQLNVLQRSNPVSNVKSPAGVPFCSGKTCLYYAGDFDSTDSNANGLFNANDSGAGEEGQVWVGVKPSAASTVTGGTFNEFLSAGFAGTQPTPFAVQTGIVSGSAGKTTCSTSGTSTIKTYGEGDFGFTQYSVTIKKLKKSCKLAKAGKASYINLLPTSSDGYGYVTNVEDAKPAHHTGWKNDLDDCFFNGAIFGDTYVDCNTQGSFDELSIALTGTK
jgi:hypothetical protein